MREIKRIIVSNGPGSYTGVRIALTLAKFFAISLNIPLCVLSSLQAMCGVKTKQIALLDARSKRAYVGLYDKGIKLRDDFVCGLDELESLLKKHPDFEVVGDRFLVGLPEQEIDFPKQMLALSKLVEDHPDVDALVPVYLKEIL
jgi:tRNA threonylcarbamoyladenosine biosynthesis protein TsaB